MTKKPEHYEPTPEEIVKAESMMSPEERQLTDRRSHLEETRLKRATVLGLPNTASWEEIERGEIWMREAEAMKESETYRALVEAVNKGEKSYDDYLTESSGLLGGAQKRFMAGREEVRKGLALEFGLSENSSWLEVGQARFNKETREKAIRLGLPKDATWSQVYAAEREEERKKRARELGLKEDTSWEVMRTLDPQWEIKRHQWIEEFGLSENATWEEITPCIIDKERKRRAKEYGLPEDTSWADINAAEKKREEEEF